jgi:hypothetical protein
MSDDVPSPNLPAIGTASDWSRYQHAVQLRRQQGKTDYTEPENCVCCEKVIAENERVTFFPCYCSGFHKGCAKCSLKERSGFCLGCEKGVRMVFTRDAEKSPFGRLQSAQEFLEA